MSQPLRSLGLLQLQLPAGCSSSCDRAAARRTAIAMRRLPVSLCGLGERQECQQAEQAAGGGAGCHCARDLTAGSVKGTVHAQEVFQSSGIRRHARERGRGTAARAAGHLTVALHTRRPEMPGCGPKCHERARSACKVGEGLPAAMKWCHQAAGVRGAARYACATAFSRGCSA